MLTDYWRDVLSLSSAGVTVLGTVLTVLGLVYTIVQLRRTKTAAEAARMAAEQSLLEARREFGRFAVSMAHRFIHEAKIHVSNARWELAAARIGDVADQAAQLASQDDEWKPLAETLREWSETCGRLARGDLRRFDAKKWAAFVLEVLEKIDRVHQPLASRREAADDN